MPVYLDCEKIVTLKGETIVAEFQHIVTECSPALWLKITGTRQKRAQIGYFRLTQPRAEHSSNIRDARLDGQ